MYNTLYTCLEAMTPFVFLKKKEDEVRLFILFSVPSDASYPSRVDDGCAAQSDRWKIGTCHQSTPPPKQKETQVTMKGMKSWILSNVNLMIGLFFFFAWRRTFSCVLLDDLPDVVIPSHKHDLIIFLSTPLTIFKETSFLRQSSGSSSSLCATFFLLLLLSFKKKKMFFQS